MRTFLQTKNLVIFFHCLLIFGILILVDYYIFWIIINYMQIQHLLLSLALISGVSTLVVLNSTIDLIQLIKKNATVGLVSYKQFSLLLVTIALGTLLIIPGFISTGLALVFYISPIRKALALILYKIHKNTIHSLFSLFLYEHM